MPEIISRRLPDLGQSFHLAVRGEIVGSVYGSIGADNKAQLESIHVNPPFRRNGLGTFLLNLFCGWARSKGAATVEGEFKPEFADQNIRGSYSANGVEISSTGTLRRDM